MDYFIKAENEATFWERLIEADVAQVFTPLGGEEPIRAVKGNNALDVIGEIYKPTGETFTGLNGEEIPVMAAIPGFHANLRGELTEEQQQKLADLLIEAPATPVRVWA